MNFASRRLTVDCRGAGDDWVAGRARRRMPSFWEVVHRPGATRVPSASAERRSAETPDWARKTRASMGVRGWQDRDEIWMVGLDAARETTMRYNWKLDEFVATILISGINVETLGTRLRISPCGTRKVRTRSGPCDAKTTREQTVWSASSTGSVSPLVPARKMDFYESLDWIYRTLSS